MHRRTFLLTGCGLVVGRPAIRAQQPSAAERALDEMRLNWKALLAADADVVVSTAPLERTREEWQKLLGRAEFAILREEDTEPPGSSRLNAEKRSGVYVCAGCSLPLFTSRMKYESGTGWPSFFTSIPKHLATKADFTLRDMRTEYHCARCGGHQGHLFDDGPPPTGERWCNNGLALRFIPKM
jgi:peptide-methionine (R)-S-oxide reductase